MASAKAAKRAHSIVGFSNDGGRPENDFYPTPPEGTLGLLKFETFQGMIWEPACGDGSMSKVLESSGYTVVSTDLEPRGYGAQGDFFFYGMLLAPNIVTNPSFRLAQQFAERALSLGCEKLALLCKLPFLEGQERKPFFLRTKLKQVYVFSERLSMTRNGEEQTSGGMIAFAWYVWERGYTGKPMIDWI
jgi:hypothetical protein